MNNKIVFIGHRNINQYNRIKAKLYSELKKQIENGSKFFTMGTHGDFDKLALCVCRELRKIYKDIKIEVVVTSFSEIKPIIYGTEKNYTLYDDVKTVMYDIETVHYKRKIVVSNQQMINNANTLICFIDTSKSFGGAILAYKYAKKKGLHIVNLYNT